MTSPTNPTPTIEQIAASLTKAQREALISANDIGITYITPISSGVSAKALHRLGLTNLTWAPSGLTPLGLSVRSLLLAQGEGK